MKKGQDKITEDNWVNIRVRRTTVKRLKIAKAEMELSIYDDLINIALNSLQQKPEFSASLPKIKSNADPHSKKEKIK